MTLSTDAISLKDFVINYIQYLDIGSGSYLSEHLSFPEFELTSFEYLNFAEKELNIGDSSSKINCVNHLKRAVDCELDTFLQVLNLYTLIKKRNLKFEKKLEIVSSMGIFRSRSLEKLNRVRNKMEHGYGTPSIDDLEIYFELVYAFVLALEGYMFMLSSKSEMYFYASDSDKFQGGALDVKYNFDKPSISYTLKSSEKTHDFLFEPSNIEDFLFAVKVLFLLCRGTILVDWNFIIDELKSVNQQIENRI